MRRHRLVFLHLFSISSPLSLSLRPPLHHSPCFLSPIYSSSFFFSFFTLTPNPSATGFFLLKGSFSSLLRRDCWGFLSSVSFLLSNPFFHHFFGLLPLLYPLLCNSFPHFFLSSIISQPSVHFWEHMVGRWVEGAINTINHIFTCVKSVSSFKNNSF